MGRHWRRHLYPDSVLRYTTQAHHPRGSQGGAQSRRRGLRAKTPRGRNSKLDDEAKNSKAKENFLRSLEELAEREALRDIKQKLQGPGAFDALPRLRDLALAAKFSCDVASVDLDRDESRELDRDNRT